MSIQDQQRSQLVKLFKDIAPYHRREKVFDDFVCVAAIAIHNQKARFDAEMEQQYLDIIAEYDEEDVSKLCELLGAFTIALINNPRDLLGCIYMELELGCSGLQQHFTPSNIQDLLSRLMCTDLSEQLATKEYLVASEPCCGSSGMIISLSEQIKELGYKSEEKLFAYCIDIDKTAVYMSYLQLSILGIPAVIYHGNTLTMEMYGSLCTPAYFTHGWAKKLTRESVTKNLFKAPLEQLSFDISA